MKYLVRRGNPGNNKRIDFGFGDASTFVNGVPPVSGKHNIVNFDNGEPRFYVVDDEEIVLLANQLGANVSDKNGAKSFLGSRSDIEFTDDLEGITLLLDVGISGSYRGKGNLWRDLSGNGYDVVLQNNVSYLPFSYTGSGLTEQNYILDYNSISFPYHSTIGGTVSGFGKNNGAIWGETDPCSGPVTFEQAIIHAHSRGARLPTLDEVQNQDAVSGTGCSYDYELVWTIDKVNGNENQRWVTAGDPKLSGSTNYAGDNEVRNITDTAYVRMIVDNDPDRSDPNIVTNDSILYNALSSNYTFSEIILDGEGIETLTFDGVDDYGYIKNLTYGGGVKSISELTVMVWMRTSFNDGDNPNDGGVSNANWAFLDFDRSEVFNFFIEGGGQLKFSGNSSNTGGFPSYYDLGAGVGTLFNDGLWHHVAVTFSVTNQEIKFYGDGILLKTHTADGNMTALGAGSQRYGFIGDGSEASSEDGNRNTFYFDGAIDYVLFYDNKCLTDTDVLENYNKNKGRYE